MTGNLSPSEQRVLFLGLGFLVWAAGFVACMVLQLGLLTLVPLVGVVVCAVLVERAARSVVPND